MQNIWFVLFILIMDFFLQNLLLGLYIFYFLNEAFVNEQSKFVFSILGLVYSVVTLAINFVSILSRRWCRDLETDEMPSKLILAVLSLLHSHYLFIAFGPRFKKPMSYAYVAGMQSS